MIETQTNLLKHYLNLLNYSLKNKDSVTAKRCLSIIHVLSPSVYAKIKSSMKNV
jgi:hypothetical protein